MNLPEFAVKILKEYAAENGMNGRDTTDLSPLEKWLIVRLFKSEDPDQYLNSLIEKASPKWKGVDADAFMDEVRGRAFDEIPKETKERVREYTDQIDAIHELVTVLRDLHDLQNGPPLECDREEYAAVMVRVIEALEKYETE